MAASKPAKTKRLVKSPETFRERALKANEASDKPGRASRLKSAGGKVTGPVLRPAGKAVRATFALKPLAVVLSLIGKVLLPVYFRNSWRELRQVQWPNWKQSRQLTFAVLVFAVIFGAVIAVVDYGLDKVFRDILLK